MNIAKFDPQDLIRRIHELGDSGRDAEGRLSRLAFSNADRIGRDMLTGWMRDARLEVSVDAIGNLFGVWRNDIVQAPLMIGSHIDSVVNAGPYDGCYGVLAGLAVIEALQAEGVEPGFPIIVAAFSNEEGARYAPDMMGSLVHAGGLSLVQALATVGTDGTLLGEELRRIGYAGSTPVGTIKPRAYLEIHIEQGPILEHENTQIGAVESLQGISWQEVTIEGVANHAGTTPTGLRHDAGLCASRIATFLRDEIVGDSLTTVATVGNIRYFPNIINVIPSKAILTVDLRDPDESRLKTAESQLSGYLKHLADNDRVSISTQQLARFEPVIFDANLVETIELVATEQQLSCRRMTSGAGHDAQMLARICPSAMIFVPSKDGISHNPQEHTDEIDLLRGFSVLLDLTRRLVSN